MELLSVHASYCYYPQSHLRSHQWWKSDEGPDAAVLVAPCTGDHHLRRTHSHTEARLAI